MTNKRIFAPNRHYKLSHLTDDELNSLIDDYYLGISIKELFEKYKIKNLTGGILHLLPTIINNELECKYCKVKLWEKLQPRKSVYSHSFKNYRHCPQCNHRDTDLCNCKNCVKEKDLEKTNNLRVFKEHLNDDFQLKRRNPIKIDDLSFWEIVVLGTLMQSGYSEKNNQLIINDFPETPIAPSIEIINKTIKKLIDKNVLLIQPSSPIKTFENINEIKNNDFLIQDIVYFINIFGIDQGTVLTKIIKPEINIETCKDSIKEVWKIIALEECIAYFNFSLKYVYLPNTVDLKAKSVFEKLLEDFSISQVFGLIARCIGYTSREFQGGKLTRKSASIYLITAIQQQGERAILNDWHLTLYRRPQELKESQLFKFFFRSILDNGESGLKLSLKELILK